MDAAYEELLTFADPNNYEILILTAKRAVAHEHFGIALRCLNKAIEEKSTNRLLYKALYEITGSLGWDFIEQHFKNECLLRFSMGERLL